MGLKRCCATPRIIIENERLSPCRIVNSQQEGYQYRMNQVLCHALNKICKHLTLAQTLSNVVRETGRDIVVVVFRRI